MQTSVTSTSEKIFNYIFTAITVAVLLCSIFFMISKENEYDKILGNEPLPDKACLADKTPSKDCLEKTDPHKAYVEKAGILGQKGDFLGGTINPVFGLLTLVMLAINAVFQLRQLNQARSQASKSERLMSIQGFEQGFFSWLQNYHTAVKSITSSELKNPVPNEPIAQSNGALTSVTKEPIKPANGAMALDALLKSFSSNLDLDDILNAPKETLRPVEDDRDRIRNRFNKRWDSFLKEFINEVGPALRILFRLIQWIDSHKSLDDREKWHYVSIARAQLSQAEHELLFFSGLTLHGTKFKPNLEKYALFDNIIINDRSLIAYLKIHGSAENIKYSDAAYNSDLAKKAMGIDKEI